MYIRPLVDIREQIFWMGVLNLLLHLEMCMEFRMCLCIESVSGSTDSEPSATVHQPLCCCNSDHCESQEHMMDRQGTREVKMPPAAVVLSRHLCGGSVPSREPGWWVLRLSFTHLSGSFQPSPLGG